jgi:hypothetical protein
MQKQIDAVRVFHEKHNFPVGLSIDDFKKLDDELVKLALTSAYDLLIRLAQSLEGHLNMVAAANIDIDPRIRRVELMVEELAETIKAMLDCNALEFLDGICDLLYVVFGTIVAFDLPAVEGFDEVQRCNMTKNKRDPNDVRLRNKGSSFESPMPGLERILYEHGQRRAERQGT